MQSLTPHPGHASPYIQELFEWVPKHCIKGTIGPSPFPNTPFMPLPDLQAFFETHDRKDKILHDLFSEPPSLETGETGYLRVFTILILLGKGTYIEHFVQFPNLRDSNLPFLVKPSHFPTDPTDPIFWERFHEKQFAFCAHYFRDNENKWLEDLCVLPITEKSAIGQGGSATLYKIRLHPHYDKLIREGGSATSSTNGLRPANTYVLKTYNTKDASKYFNNEVDAFKKLASKDRHDCGLIQFFGSYKQGDTHNVLLEYADLGTLESFFMTRKPPTRAKDIVMFWGRLINVLKALVRIHAIERPNGFHGPDILIGWHQDVKPKNILVFSGKTTNPYDVVFKLADLGLSHFKRVKKMSQDIVDRDVGGTKDYGAPECHRSDTFLEQCTLKVLSSVDIWSFGAVCSEAAVWVPLGMLGVTSYRNQRQQEIASKHTLQDGSCFHHRGSCLQAVDTMHHYVLKPNIIRPADCVTRPILNTVMESMLVENPEERQSALGLYRIFQDLLEKAEEKMQNHTQDTVWRNNDITFNKPQFLGWNAPNTPPHTSYGAAPPTSGINDMQDPPDFAQNDLNPLTPNRSPFSNDPLKRNSETWHGRSARMEVTPMLPNIITPPQTAKRQAFRTSPPPDLFYQPSTEPRILPFDQLGSLKNSLLNDSRELELLDRAPFTQPVARYSSTRKARHSNGTYHAQPFQNNVNSSPIKFPKHRLSDPTADLQTTPLISAALTNGYAPFPTIAAIPGSQMEQGDPHQAPLVQAQEGISTIESSASEVKQEIPHLAYADAKRIRESRCNLQRDHQVLLNDLKGRDHVFLIDDSRAMREYWDDVISFFSVFAYFVKRLDDDGLEMWFTVSGEEVRFSDTKKAVTHLKRMRPSGLANFDLRLGKILERYQKVFQHKAGKRGFFWLRTPQDVKPLSLYVLTDGSWASGSDAVAPIEKIIKLSLPDRQVGIQFIRFGNHLKGIERLEYLDKGLRKKHGKKHDIVDTEPFQGGNILKMLLGTIWPLFDGDDDDDDDSA